MLHDRALATAATAPMASNPGEPGENAMSGPFDLTNVIGHEVSAGTNLLVTGPPMSGTGTLAMDTLAADFADDDSAIVVTTNNAARDVLETLGKRVGSDDRLYGVASTARRRALSTATRSRVSTLPPTSRESVSTSTIASAH